MKGIIKRWLPYLPETLLLTAGLALFFGDLIATSKINWPIVVACLVILSLVIWKNKFLAISLSALLGIVSIYFLLALLAEFMEFPSGDVKGLTMLLTGGVLFGSLLAAAVFLPKKYLYR